MKKQIILLVLIIISAFALFNVVSAADVSNGSEDSSLILNSSTSNISNNYTNESNSTDYRKYEIFVRFKSDNLTNEGLEEVSKNANLQIGATLLKNYDEVKGLELVEIPESVSLQDAIAKYLQNPDVLYAEPNYIYKKETIPNDSDYTMQWGLSQINAPEAWDITTGSSNVIIAVVDSGIDLNHPDLKANIWINPGETPGNGIDDDHNGYVDDVYGWHWYHLPDGTLAGDNNITDDNGHGTHVAGIIAAVGNNTQGVTGIMWNATIMPLKFLDQNGDGYLDDAVSAISYATKMGASIISCSWGGSGYSKALKDVIDASSALVVCAAGNEYYSVNNDISPFYPASFTSENIISVAAVDQNDNLAYFSNYGVNSVDVAAPGTSIYSTWPGSSYGYMQGTSMATPYVSGLAGLIKSIRPDLSNLQIKYTILDNVDSISSLAGKILTGGRINALKALTNIITDSTAPTASADLKGGSYYYSPLTISLTASKPGNIYYTLDGTNPTASSPIYRSPLTLYTSQTIKFMTIDTSGTLSGVYLETYSLYKLVDYSYQVWVPYKKSKKKYKQRYKVAYKYKGKIKYKWKYKWVYRWYYRFETRYGQKYDLI